MWSQSCGRSDYRSCEAEFGSDCGRRSWVLRDPEEAPIVKCHCSTSGFPFWCCSIVYETGCWGRAAQVCTFAILPKWTKVLQLVFQRKSGSCRKREPRWCLFCSQMETKVWVTHAWFNPSAICRGTREDECHDPSVSLSAPFSLSAVPNLSRPSALEQGGTRLTLTSGLRGGQSTCTCTFITNRGEKGIILLHHSQIVRIFCSIWMIVEESNHQVLFNPAQNLNRDQLKFLYTFLIFFFFHCCTRGQCSSSSFND